MTQTSYPDPAGSNVVTDVKYEALMSAIVGDGIYGTPTNPAPVFGDSSGRQVKVRANSRGAVRGYGWEVGGSDDVLSISANATGNPRIDRVVLRLDRSTWLVRAVVKTGTASATPVEPTLQRDLDAAGAGSGLFEIPLASVAVASGAATITAANVVSEAYYNGPQRIVCTSTTRPPHAAGLPIYEVDTGNSYTSTGSVWASPTHDGGWVAVTPSSGWSNPGSGFGCRIRAVNGIAYMMLEVQRTGSPVAAGVDSTMANYGASYAPSFQLPVMAYVDGVDALCNVKTDGTVLLNGHQPISTGDLVTLTMAAWPIG